MIWKLRGQIRTSRHRPLGLRYTKYFAQSAEPFPATPVEDQDEKVHTARREIGDE